MSEKLNVYSLNIKKTELFMDWWGEQWNVIRSLVSENININNYEYDSDLLVPILW